MTTTPDAVDYDADDAVIKLTSDIAAVTPSGRIALIKRRWEPFEGCWALPGGKVNIGETSRAAAVREAAEEVGLKLGNIIMVPVGLFDEPDRDPRGRYVSVAYFVVVPDGTPLVAADDAAEAKWWPLDELPDLAFDHDQVIDAARSLIEVGEIDFFIGD